MLGAGGQLCVGIGLCMSGVRKVDFKNGRGGHAFNFCLCTSL